MCTPISGFDNNFPHSQKIRFRKIFANKKEIGNGYSAISQKRDKLNNGREDPSNYRLFIMKFGKRL